MTGGEGVGGNIAGYVGREGGGEIAGQVGRERDGHIVRRPKYVRDSSKLVGKFYLILILNVRH